MFCPYKNIFGEPAKGVHSYRFMDIAVVDVLCTIIGAFLISYWFHTSILWTLSVLFLTGIGLHRLFCVRTTIDKILFG
jgi:hypothetical protein